MHVEVPDRGDRPTPPRGHDQSDRETIVLTPVPPPGRVPSSLRDVSFSSAVRGYDRREVDAYVRRVNGVIAELEIAQSPESAVKHALDRVGEQTAEVLQRAREAAEQLTATAVAESEHATRRAKVEAAETLERARQEAETLRTQSAEEAAEVTTRAERVASDRLARAEAKAASIRKREEARLAQLADDIASASQARRAALQELGRIATELGAFAAAAESGPLGAPRPPGADDPDGASEDVPAAASDDGATEDTRTPAPGETVALRAVTPGEDDEDDEGDGGDAGDGAEADSGSAQRTKSGPDRSRSARGGASKQTRTPRRPPRPAGSHRAR